MVVENDKAETFSHSSRAYIHFLHQIFGDRMLCQNISGDNISGHLKALDKSVSSVEGPVGRVKEMVPNLSGKLSASQH